MTQDRGKVYLVGAGSGDIAYLTVRAQQLLTEAEVLVYDALVDAQLLQLVSSECLKFDVGKRGGKPSTPQAEIDQLLVEQCQRGLQVVRLKSGDPFIFGRSSSEIQALITAGCPFEVVPGISSALGSTVASRNSPNRSGDEPRFCGSKRP
jgi:siroheme synthase